MKRLATLIKTLTDNLWNTIPEWLKKIFRFVGYCLLIITIGFLVNIGAVLAISMFMEKAHAAEPVNAREVTIPNAANRYRATLVRAAHATWGLDAPVAVFAAQVHTESWWRNNTTSHAGAQGLAQFMPETARWLPSVAPETGNPEPFNPGWSLRALCTYDKWLWERVIGHNDFERMAFTLSAYNGGLGWVNRDKRKARSLRLDDKVWFGSVEHVNAGRSAAAFRENRQYPRLILKERQQAYIRAGWGPGIDPGA